MVIINDVKDITGLLIDEPVLKNTSKVIEITRDEFLKAARDYDDYVNRMSSINYEHDIESYDLIKSTREYLGFELLVINVDKRFFKVYFDNEINSIKSVCLINDKGDEEILDVESIVSSNIEFDGNNEPTGLKLVADGKYYSMPVDTDVFKNIVYIQRQIDVYLKDVFKELKNKL